MILPEDFVSNFCFASYTLKKQSVTMIKLCKSISDQFTRMKDTYCRFRSSVDEIFVREMRNN